MAGGTSASCRVQGQQIMGWQAEREGAEMAVKKEPTRMWIGS